MKQKFSLLLLDFVIVVVSFTLVAIFKPYGLVSYYHNYFTDILSTVILWIPISLGYKKYRAIRPRKPLRRFLLPILQSNLTILGFSAVLMIVFHFQSYSNAVILGTLVGATILEIFFWNLLHYMSRLNELGDENSIVKAMRSKTVVTDTSLKRRFNNIPTNPEELEYIHKTVSEEVGEEVYRMLDHWVNLASPACQLLSTTTRFNVQKLNGCFECFVNLKRLNDVRYLNKFFETINEKLNPDGIFIGYAETKDLRKHRILHKYPVGLNYLMYTIDFCIKRVFPKFKLTQGLYYLITRGQNRVLSKAEIFGRLYSCGFEVLDEVFANRHLFFLAHKTGKPHYDPDPTYGPLIKLRRLGKDGRTFNVYKFRTMHPYAEYLQEYVYKKYDLQPGGKFKDDFRVSTLGRFLRKFWLDEFPMLYNVLKGDLKFVGVRPLSRHYFSLYSKELQEKRLKFKPGLVPPFYADMPGTLDEIQESEMRYLLAYEKKPFLTDIRYFFKAFWNIFFRKARSN